MKKQEPIVLAEESADLTWKEAKRILRKNGLKAGPFNKWMIGQTCPAFTNVKGGLEPGVYAYDLNRYIRHAKYRTPLLFD
jgi:hypothetical protein